MKFPGSAAPEHFLRRVGLGRGAYGPKNFTLPISIYFKVYGPHRGHARRRSLLVGGSLFMTRWSIPLACLLVGGLLGSFVAGPVLHGQNPGQPAAVANAPKELTSY